MTSVLHHNDVITVEILNFYEILPIKNRQSLVTFLSLKTANKLHKLKRNLSFFKYKQQANLIVNCYDSCLFEVSWNILRIPPSAAHIWLLSRNACGRQSWHLSENIINVQRPTFYVREILNAKFLKAKHGSFQDFSKYLCSQAIELD